MSRMQDPASRTEAVTPSDTTTLSGCRSLFIGTTGDVNIQGEGDDTATLHKNVPSGSHLPIRAMRVFATSTTATDIVAWY